MDIPTERRRLSPAAITGIFEMIRANLERSVLLIHPLFLITDDIAPFADPDWEYISLVYQILLRYQELYPRSAEIDLGFLKFLFKRIGSPEEREHSSIIQVVMQFCAQSRARPFTAILTELCSELANWSDSPNYMFAITVTLSITASILRDYPGSGKFATPFTTQFLLLMTVNSFLFFKTHFFTFISLMLNNDPAFAGKALLIAVHFWPHKTTSKQGLFIRLFAMTVSKVAPRQMSSLLPKVLAILVTCMNSASGRVAEQALTFFTDRSLDGVILSNAQIILPTVCDAVREASANHWCAEVRELAKKAASRLALIDGRLFHELSRPSDTAGQESIQKMQAWIRITDAAAKNGHRVGAKVAEIARAFGRDSPRLSTRGEPRSFRRPANPPPGMGPRGTVRDATPPPILRPFR
jgi:hypothetical protein